MLHLKEKQKQVIEAINNPSIHTIVLIGAVGTGKTDIAAHIGISIADTFPRTYFTVFRQNISTAKRTVIPSYLNMLYMMNMNEGTDYDYNRQDFEIKFPNGSKIGFVEADITKDREGKKIKGINATANHIDEADELHEVMFTNAVSRRGRRNTEGQPSVSIITMNPNDTYLKGKYYDPWKDGTLPQGVVVIEFTLEDSWQSQQDINELLTNPKPWVERYLLNNWAYKDDLDSLFKYRYFDQAIVSQLNFNDIRTGGYDVARNMGGDRSVEAMWYGNTLVDISIFKEKNEEIKTDDQAMMLIRYMTENAILADNQVVDSVGLGVGVVDHMHSKGISVREYKSGAKPTLDNYDMLRSQIIYMFAQGLEKGKYKIYEGCPFRNELVSEAMLHLHKVTDKTLSVESKDEIKKRTGGLSPDIFDAVVMGLYPQLKLDPKDDTNRIVV